jgi:rod shape determining protein RodA
LKRTANILSQIDWLTVGLFYLLVFAGWLNIFASVYDEEIQQNIFDLSLNSGRQLIFIGSTLLLITIILAVDFRFYDSFAYILYGIVIALLIYVIIFGREINGAKSWIEIGSFRMQPSEFAKFAAALALAKYTTSHNFRIDRFQNQILMAMIIGLPAVLTMLQGDTGTALIFGAFILVLFREGMSPVLLIIGISFALLFILTLLVNNHLFLYGSVVALSALMIALGQKSFKRIAWIVGGAIIVILTIRSVDFAFNNILKPHQQNRMLVLLNPNTDPLGAGWNVTQSKIAIGSGGIDGKGFLKGTQTKFDFVPEQSTDFIFCTIGEEHGWFGSLVLISLFIILLLRIIALAERQKQTFTRVYGYSVAAILFFHFSINIGMTIGLFPVIGIPLPFFSYGGSALMSFTILLFILLKLDAHRAQMLAR